MSPHELLTRLTSAPQMQLTVPDPVPALRSAYRQAIWRVINERLAPEGLVLRHTGRDRGDLVIQLVVVDEAPAREVLSSIAVPDRVDGLSELVREVQSAPEAVLPVEDASRERALRILQAVNEECVRRGYSVGLRDDRLPTFQIAVDATIFRFSLLEEYESREVVDPQEVTAARYEWQRLPVTVGRIGSGRLVIRLEDRFHPHSWADRKRWSLQSRLPLLFKEIEQRAVASGEMRRRQQDERQQRRQAWRLALEHAEQALVHHSNAQRLSDQTAALAKAEDLRRYAARLQSLVHSGEAARYADEIRGWTTWVLTEADRIDPLRHPEELRLVRPEIRPSDLDKFMPRGLSAWGPPD